MKVDILNKEGAKVSELELNDQVFGIEPHNEAIYLTVKAELAALRQGTHKVKGRSEVSGGGRKPYRQKGTGRARQGSIRAAQHVGGGVIFGPTPRSYNKKVNKKVSKLAMKSALSHHVQNNTLVVVEDLNLDSIKTKVFANILTNLKVTNKPLIVVENFTKNLVLSARNIKSLNLSQVNHASVYEILNANHLVITKDAIKELEGRLA